MAFLRNTFSSFTAPLGRSLNSNPTLTTMDFDHMLYYDLLRSLVVLTAWVFLRWLSTTRKKSALSTTKTSTTEHSPTQLCSSTRSLRKSLSTTKSFQARDGPSTRWTTLSFGLPKANSEVASKTNNSSSVSLNVESVSTTLTLAMKTLQSDEPLQVLSQLSFKRALEGST